MRFWPDERQALLLRAALLGGAEAGEAWRRWNDGGRGLDGADGLSYGLLPLAYRNLVANGVEDPVLPRLKGVYRHTWYANQRVLSAAGGPLRALRDAGLETLVLGGIPLAALHYRDAGARSVGEIEVAVPAAQAVMAIDALRAAGWALETPLPVDRLTRSFPEAGLVDAEERRLALHWSLLSEPGSDASLWRAAVPLDVGGVPTLALASADQLLLTCAGGFGVPRSRLRWIADATTVVRAAGDGLDWDRLVGQALARRMALATDATLRYLCDGFGVGVPERVLAVLDAVPATARERVVHRVAGFEPAHGGAVVKLWDRHRRLRTIEHDGPMPDGFLEMLAAHWSLSRRRQIVPQLARRSLAIAARRPSHA